METESLFISAGDPSGDIATARVLSHLQKNHPSLACFGLGGKRLQALGQVQLADPDRLAVLGFWEVLKQIRFFSRLLNQCVEEISKRRPKAILLVDYPGFNLRLAARIKHLNIPIVYYISPQIWAWGKGRLPKMRRLIDRMLVILPFEKKFFADHQIESDFVGHYLVEDIPSAYIGSSAPRKGRVALLPGSRRQEIERMLPVMLSAAKLFCGAHGYTATVAAVRCGFDYEALVAAYPNVNIIYDDSRRVISESDLVLTASGTATLETAIIGRPMVVIYKTGFVTYQIARRLVRLDRIGLVNLVAGKKVVPELIQSEANARRISEELSRFVTDAAYHQQVSDALREIPDLLGGMGASVRTAEAIGEYL